MNIEILKELPWLTIKDNQLYNSLNGDSSEIGSYEYYNMIYTEALQMYENGESNKSDEELYYIVTWCENSIKSLKNGIIPRMGKQPNKKYGYLSIALIILSILIVIFL